MWQWQPTPNPDELYHHGILKQKWGVRRFQNKDGSLTPAGRRRYGYNTVFVSGSSKTQDKNSPFYLKKLPKQIRRDLKDYMRSKDTIIVGDAPGFDRQVQDYIKRYKNVEIYSPGTENRYKANKNWKNHLIDAPEYEKGSDQWLAKKDIAMTNRANKGLALTINGGSQATRNNIQRLIDQNKNVKTYELFENKKVIKKY